MTAAVDALRFDRINPEGTRYELLPLDDDAAVYRARLQTAEAILQLVDGEIHVPAVEREERGDFADLLDAVVAELPTDRVRFVGARHPDDPPAANEAWDALTPDDARPLYEVVDGFDFETRTYTLPDGDTEPTDTLVGRWRVD